MAPMILPFAISGMPPREAITSSSVATYIRPAFWMASSKALVGRRYLAAVRALCWEIESEASCAVHALERDQVTVGIDHRDVERPVPLLGLGLDGGD